MPEPALTFWLIGAPLIAAVFDLFRTRAAVKTAGASRQRGEWSRALGLNDKVQP